MKEDTLLVALGRPTAAEPGPINYPVHRASTILFEDLDRYLERHSSKGDAEEKERIHYGAMGSCNSQSLAEAISAIEQGCGSVITSTGLSAITMAFTAVLEAGDHLLLPDSIYGPARQFCLDTLRRFGIETSFYDPTVGADIEHAIKDNTRLVHTEAPGSLTFEMQDIPAIVEVAHAKGALVTMDNTWATPLYFRPLQHGVDISIQAGTKYISGHSDLVIGAITAADPELFATIRNHVNGFGDVASPDDCFLALRGLRSLSIRLARHQESAYKVVHWLTACPQVKQVLWPALETDIGHELWRRDFSGASSLFGLALHSEDEKAIKAMVDGLRLFRIGSSWGGYESLIAGNRSRDILRESRPWTDTPFLLRLHIGLEDPDDIIADLEAGFERLDAFQSAGA
ncbi:cystathionine beta-lyase [Thioalkalivibrio sp. HK1]|uniref:cystathionine beta-lyase n=1 Tax=Thioalkalivibrio sp. HK1 TaxID=1469245 RepID=UPI000471CDE6|nr:cystathionine beta-lyase [Thioalkalivibrio sp. HK1]